MNSRTPGLGEPGGLRDLWRNLFDSEQRWPGAVTVRWHLQPEASHVVIGDDELCPPLTQ